MKSRTQIQEKISNREKTAAILESNLHSFIENLFLIESLVHIENKHIRI